ncbi:MAG: YfiR family protein [Gammaproteobacteria bacterium]|nr:YfiR family protein [Gammaproteobacteria bacterium]
MVKKGKFGWWVFSVSLIKRLSLILMVLTILGGLSTPAWSQFEEYALKAVLMEKFTHFIQWPNTLTNGFKLCVVGENPFKGALHNLAALTRINDEPTTFVNIDGPDAMPDCTMLFIGHSKQHSLARILDRLHRSPVLTVSDTPGFARRGVMINFVIKDSKIHFEINPEAAHAAGLKISSRLLKLATIMPSVTGGENKEKK